MTNEFSKSRAVDVRHFAAVVLVVAAWSFVGATPNAWGKKGGGENDAQQPLAVTVDTNDTFGIFGDGNGDYLDSDQGTFAGMHVDGVIRIATTGPGVSETGANRSLVVVLPDGTELDSGSFDLRVEPIPGLGTPRDLKIGESTFVDAWFSVNDIEGGTSNNRVIYYGKFPGTDDVTGGPLMITRIGEYAWVLETLEGFSRARIAELVKFRGTFSWETIYDLDSDDPIGAGELPLSMTIVEIP